MTEQSDAEDRTVLMQTAAPGLPPAARMVCLDSSSLRDPDSAEIALEFGAVTIGRASSNTVVLHADGVSRNHARLEPTPLGWEIQDAGSENGVVINGNAISAPTSLSYGDEITLGTVRYRYEEVVAPEAEVIEEKQDEPAAADKTVVLKPSQRATLARAAATGGAVKTPQPAKKTPKPEPPPPTIQPELTTSGKGMLFVGSGIVVVVVIAALIFLFAG